MEILGDDQVGVKGCVKGDLRCRTPINHKSPCIHIYKIQYFLGGVVNWTNQRRPI